MASSLQRIGKHGRTLIGPLYRSFASSADALVDYKLGEIGLVSGIPDEHLTRRVVIYSPARTASQQGFGRVGRWKINFVSTQKWENPLMGWTSTGDPYANVGDSALTFDSEEAAKSFAERHGWEYVVFDYLGELNDSLSYALGAGSLFDVSEDSDYVHTLLAKAIDEYASIKSKAAESNVDPAHVDPRLEAIVERMLDKCIMDGKYQQALGTAIECRRLDKLEEAILRSDNVHGTLSYCINVSHSFVNRREYRSEVLRLLFNVYQKLPSPDYLSIFQCPMFLDKPEGVAGILEKLLHSSNDETLQAYQVAFDLVENEHQAFLLNVKAYADNFKFKGFPKPEEA